MNSTLDRIRVIITEDEPVVAADLEKQLTDYGMNVVANLDEGEDVLDFLKKHLADIILMDIQLAGSLDGIDTAQRINNNHNIPIIFLTANTDRPTFNRAKMTFPHSFLSKPFRINDVINAIELALDTEGPSQEAESQSRKDLNDRIFVRDKDGLYKVLFDHILFVEADGAYTKIITPEKIYTVSQTLKNIEEKLDSKHFIRVHRSYVINVKKVDKISEGHVRIEMKEIPVSRTYRDDLLKVYQTI